MRNNKKHEINPFEEVDCEVSTDVLSVLCELSKTALKVFCYIANVSYCENDILYLDKKELKEFFRFKENKSIYNGLNELIKHDIIACTKVMDEFYYNKKFIK